LNYIHHIPCHPAVRKYISSIWLITDDHPQTEVFEKVIPHGGLELIFELGAPCQYINSAGNAETVANIAITGHSTTPVYVKSTGPFKSLGINFSPCVPVRFLGTPANEYTDRIVSLDETSVPMYQWLLEQLCYVSDANQMFLLTEQFFIPLIRNLPHQQNTVLSLANHIIQKEGNITVKDIADHYVLSKRRLEQKFIEEVGLSAGAFIKKVRFLNVFKKLQRHPTTSLTALALDSGYYDQSHFIREFRSFTGSPPSHYFKNKSQYDLVFTPTSPLLI
jgi:AraC-like DNA-binding protein